MWQSQLFGSLPMLLEFVNARKLAHDQFKIAIVPPRLWQRRSSPRYYLIHWVDDPDESLVAVGTTAAARTIEAEEEAAVDTATEIIAQARRDGEDVPH